MKKKALRIESLVLVLTLIVTCLVPGFSKILPTVEASAATHEIDIVDANGNSVTQQIKVMESEQVQLSYKLIDCSMPEGGYVVWKSDTPLNASVDQTGVVRGHDSSKGAAVRLWLENDVKTIPIIGNSLAKTLESILYSDNIDLDTMDTESIVNVVSETLGGGSVANSLVNSLRDRLNSIDTTITVCLYDQFDSLVATDSVHVLVTNSDKWYANVIPNGAFILNKDSLPTTVAVGGKLTLEGGVTPLRLGYGVTWSISGKTIFDKAEDFATFDESTGEIVFLKEGQVTVKVAPNADQIVDKLMGYINDLAELGNEVDTADIADILVKVMGLNVSTNTVKFVIDIIAAAAGAGTNTASLITQAVKYVANWTLEATINDSITFTIVDSLEIKGFEIGGDLEVKEGETSQLYITNVIPQGANSTNVVWSVEDESIAYVDKYGILIGRDAGGISSINKKTTKVTASVDGISASAEVTVTGKLVTQPVDIKVLGPSVVQPGETVQYNAKVYPDRSNAAVRWGLVGDDGKIVYAKDGASVSNTSATIDSDGNFTALEGGGGLVQIAVKAGTISTCERTFDVYIGTLAQGIEIDQGDFLSVEVPTSKTYNNMSTQLTVTFNPPNASNQNVRWSVLDGKNIEVSPSGVVKPSKNSSAWGIIQAKSFDGGFTDTIYVSFANYPVTGVTVNPTTVDLIVGEKTTISTTVAPEGWGASGAKIGDASIKTCHWTSSDNSVAKVENGVVTAVNSGTCTITATTVDGGYQASATITVRPDKTRLIYAMKLFESGKLDEENCPPDDWAALTEAYNTAVEVMNTEFAYQHTCDKAAQAIIDLYDKVGAYVQLFGVEITLGEEAAPDFYTVQVDTSKSYKTYSVDFGHKFNPENAMYASMEWKSESPSVTVDQNGVCSPSENKACASVITFTAIDYLGNAVSDSVVVAFANYPVTGVTLDKTEITDALVYNTGKLTPTIAPEGWGASGAKIGDASIKDVIWTTSDASVVSVDENGNLTYNGTGTAIVTVLTLDGGFTATCEITVSVNKTMLAETIAEMDSYNLVEEEWTVKTFDDYKAAYATATALMSDPNATQKQVDDAKAELILCYNSLKRFIKTEDVIIQVDGQTAPEYISVKSPLYTTANLQLVARVLPLDSMYVSVEWSTDSSSIKVDENGKVTPASGTAAGYGWVTVTVTDERGNVVTDKVHVSFAMYPVSYLTITPESIETSLDVAPVKLSVEAKHVATSVVTHNATIQKVYWSSDNDTIVSVDENGQLTYNNAGQATITATAADGGIQATCVVTVAGDKSRLRAAIAEADEAAIDIQQYTYETSMAYVSAYEHAIEVEGSVVYTQEEIDAAADNLSSALAALEPYIHMTDLNVYYNGSTAPEFISIKVPTHKTYTSQSVTLTYDYAPADAMFSSIVWSSSNPNVSCENGVVKPIKNEACGSTITLTATDHYGNKIEKTVYVAFANYEATGITIDKTEFTVSYGASSQTITATVVRDAWDNWFGPSVSDVVWRTTDPDVATVENGVVTFVEAGTCEIIASTLYGGHSAVCKVTVLSDSTPLQEVYAMTTALNLKHEEYTAESWAPFIDAYNKAAMILALNNPKQRDIDAATTALWDTYNNLEKYIKVQNVIITYNGADAASHISQTVGLAANYTNSSIGLGYRILPANATWASITWSSSNSTVAVSSAGVCTPTVNEACWSLITLCVTDTRGRAYTDTVYVAFAKYQVTGISVSPSEINDAVVGTTSQITYSITPKATAGVGEANIKDVMWSSSDESIAVVYNGTVEFHNTGIVKITATTCDGGYQASTTIKVYADKSALKEIIEYVDTLVYTDYTPATWAVLQEKYNEALAVYNAEDPSQAEVNAAKEVLSDAISDLIEYVYISDVKISCDGNTSDFINVIVAEDQAYLAASAVVEYIVTPDSAMYTDVEWSYDGSIVFNPVSGLVAPMYNTPCFGRLYLTITDDFGNEYKTTSYVTFSRNPIESVTLDKNLVEVNVNSDDFQLVATVLGVNGGPADISEVVWTSSDTSVATVDENGVVSIHAGGYAEIKAESVVGGYYDICKVYVTTDKSALGSVLQQTIDENYQRLDYIETTYNAYLEAYDYAVRVYSNNEASQEEIDRATEWLTNAINALEPYIHVDSILVYNDITNNADDFVTSKISKWVSIKGETVQLSYVINPSDAMYESIEWLSDNSNISVDQNGLVKAEKNEKHVAGITLTITDYYGVKYTKTIYVAFVNDPVTGISISKSELTGYSGGTDSLSCTVQPDSGLYEADVKDVIWSTSDESVAMVNNEGKVYFVDGGECYITVTTKDGGHSASCKVIVTATDAKLALAEAIRKAKNMNADLYTEDSYAVLADAIAYAESVYNIALATTTQINEAIMRIDDAKGQLVYVLADYTVVEDAIKAFNELDRTQFNESDLQAIQDIIDSIDWNLDVSNQDRVNEYAGDINYAISTLPERDADLVALNKAIEDAEAVERSLYSNADILDEPLMNAIEARDAGYKISDQSLVDFITSKLNNAINSLELKGADKAALVTAVNLKLTYPDYLEFYDADLLAAWEAIVVEGKAMANDKSLTILDNDIVSAKAEEVYAAYEAVEASFKVVIVTEGLNSAIEEAENLLPDDYIDNPQERYQPLVDAVNAGKALLLEELNNPEDQTRVNEAEQNIRNLIDEMFGTPADYTEVNNAVERFEAVDKFVYTDDSVQSVQDLIDGIDWEYTAVMQDVVDSLAAEINKAIDNLVLTEETKIEAIESVGSTVNEDKKFIYGVDEGLDDIEEYVRIINGTIVCTETPNGLGTGSVIDVVDKNGEIVDSYTLVIFGDVNGDGFVDAQDSLYIWVIIMSGDTATNAQNFAADVNRDGFIDQADMDLVEQVGALNATVEQR